MRTFIIIRLLLPCFFLSYANAQDILQVIKGRILDKESKQPLPLAGIMVYKDSALVKTGLTDTAGYFRIPEVPLGKYYVKATYMGYNPVGATSLLISGKELFLIIELEESVVSKNEVIIVASKKEEAINEMTSVSSRTFSVEETERYAGSRQDPARMASSFAGVRGSDDSRNDIVIRGNSPMGVLWRLEGIDIPNPNHFAVPGTTGGPVSMLNNKMLSNSDFMTGAFPAEYGNALAGVFDLKMRNGSDEKHEFTGQLGFLGTELTAEGPVSKDKHASYLLNYRYSTLKLFESMHIKIGTSAVPLYQDGSFKINFPSKHGNTSVFGMGGTSKIAILVSTYDKPQTEIYGDKDRDQYFNTSLGVAGISHSHAFSSTLYAKITLAASYNNAHANHNLVYRGANYGLDSIIPKMGYDFTESKYTVAVFLNKKYNAKNTLKLGINTDRIYYNLIDSNYSETTFYWENRENYSGGRTLLQPYIQWKYRIRETLTINSGLHLLYLQNSGYSIEPRIGVCWLLEEGQMLSFGFGVHSQAQPGYIYFHQSLNSDGSYSRKNEKIKPSRSNHFVASYDRSFTKTFRMKTELYFQQLYNIPVTYIPSSYSLLNEGSSFSRFFPDSLVNTGSGRNYGFEITMERFFSKTYFLLFTSSLYDSKYRASNGKVYNTDFNGRYSFNMLAGKEARFGKSKKNAFIPGAKITWAGGRRYTPVDTISSTQKGELVEQDSLRNTKQFRDYFRADIKLGLRLNARKVTHEIAIDLVNILNTKNILSVTYVPGASNPLREEYQLGFLPLFYYKIDF